MDDVQEYISIRMAAQMLGKKERRVMSFVRRHKGIKYYKQSKRVTKILCADLERFLINSMLHKLHEDIRV